MFFYGIMRDIKTMKVCLYFEAERLIQTSGIGRALHHQKKALEWAGIDYTLDPNEEYDILHINTLGPNSQRIIASARRRHKPVLYHAHSTEEDFRNSYIFSNQVAPLFKTYIKNLYKKADAIATPTPYAKRLIQSYGIKKPIYPISNGIDVDRYQYDAEKVKAFRRYFHLEDNQKVVIGVGLYLPRKGLQDFLDVAKEFPELTFIWFGHSPLLTIPSSLRLTIEQHPDNVILPGYVKGPIIEGAYASADLFFFPSYEETEGIVVLEALAARCPVLVRDIGVYEDWLIQNENCYKGRTNAEFIATLRAFFNQNLPSTVEAGYRVAQDRSLDKIGQELKTIYQTLLKEKL